MNHNRTAMCLFHVALGLPRPTARRVFRVVADLNDLITQTLTEEELVTMAAQKAAMLDYVTSLKPSALKRLGIAKTKPLTSGFNGLLFSSTNPNLVIKASMDINEYRAAKKLLKQRYKHIAAIVHVERRELDDGQDLYFLMLERLYPLSNVQQDVLTRVLDPLWASLDRTTIDALEAELVKERDRSYTFVKHTLSELVDICVELKQARLWHTDLHSRNIMTDSEGTMKLVDLAAIRSS